MVRRSTSRYRPRLNVVGRALLAMAVGCAALTVAAVPTSAAAGSFVVDHTVNPGGAISYYSPSCAERNPEADLVATAPDTQIVESGDSISLTFRFDPPLVVSRNVFYLGVVARLQDPSPQLFGGSSFSPVSMSLVGSNLAAIPGAYGTAVSWGTGFTLATGFSLPGGGVVVDPTRDGVISEVHASYTLPAGLRSTVIAQVTVSTEGRCGDPLLYPQVSCLAGFYANGGSCVPADPGYFVDVDGATAQSPCPAGTYQPNVGQAQCLRAQPGYYVPIVASIAEFACSPGSFQSNSGGTTCNAAPPGNYVSGVAASAAVPCAPGTYQPFAGLTLCVVAEPGFYVPTAGSAVRLPCPAGTTSDAGAIACRPLDGLAPTITITTPANGAQYLLGAAVNANYTCTDEPGGSGVATCNGPVANGAAIDTSTIGAKTFRVDTADNAGNTRTASAPYRVVYGFSGFGAPVDAAPTVNAAKAGRTIPLKFRVTAANGTGITNLTAVRVTVASLACATGATVDDLEEYASGNSGLQNLGNGFYQFNWSTPSSYAQSCKTLSVDLGDGVARSALFRFTR